MREEIIDFSSHVLPEAVVKEIKDLGIKYAHNVSKHIEVVFTHTHYRDVDIPRRIEILRKYGITYQVVCFGPNYVWLINEDDRDKRDKILLRLTRIANNAIAEMVDKYKDYFIGLATIPILYGEAIDELERSIRDLGLKGVQIYSNIYGKPIDLEEFRRFYETVRRLGIPVFIHPQTHEYYPWIYEYSLFQIFGWPFDTTLAMARLVFSGITRQYPEIPFVTHHVGGMVPYYRGRIAGTYGSRELHGFRFKLGIEDPLEEFRRFYADTASFGVRETIEMGLEFFGRDRVIFGTDYPFGPEQGIKYLRDTLNAVKSINIDDETKRKILWDNAARLLKIQ